MPSAPLHPCACSPTCPVLLPPGLARCRPGARQQEQQRPHRDARRWYHTVAWQALRRDVLREEPCCRECLTQGLSVAATQVDHIVPHRGDSGRFWDRQNLAGLCATCHARKTQQGQ